MSNLSLKRASSEDITWLLALHKTNFAGYAEEGKVWEASAQQAMLERHLSEWTTEIILYNDEPIGRLTSKVTGELTLRHLWILYLDILPSFQKRGLGTSVMKNIIRNVHSSDEIRYIHLDVLNTNQVSRRFFSELGFEDYGPVDLKPQYNCMYYSTLRVRDYRMLD